MFLIFCLLDVSELNLGVASSVVFRKRMSLVVRKHVSFSIILLIFKSVHRFCVQNCVYYNAILVECVLYIHVLFQLFVLKVAIIVCNLI